MGEKDTRTTRIFSWTEKRFPTLLWTTEQTYIYYIHSKGDFEENTIDLRREIKTRNFADAILSTYLNSDNNKEKEEKKRENGIVTPECYHSVHLIFLLAPLLLALFSPYRRFDGTKASLPPSRLSRFDCLIFPARKIDYSRLAAVVCRSPSKSATNGNNGIVLSMATIGNTVPAGERMFDCCSRGRKSGSSPPNEFHGNYCFAAAYSQSRFPLCCAARQNRLPLYRVLV